MSDFGPDQDYWIINQNGLKSLDVRGRSVDEGAQVQIWDTHPVPNQHFRLSADGSAYHLFNPAANRYLAVRDRKLVLGSRDPSPESRFTVEVKSDQVTCAIRHAETGGYLSVEGEPRKNGSDVGIQSRYGGGFHQHWGIVTAHAPTREERELVIDNVRRLIKINDLTQSYTSPRIENLKDYFHDYIRRPTESDAAQMVGLGFSVMSLAGVPGAAVAGAVLTEAVVAIENKRSRADTKAVLVENFQKKFLEIRELLTNGLSELKDPTDDRRDRVDAMWMKANPVVAYGRLTACLAAFRAPREGKEETDAVKSAADGHEHNAWKKLTPMVWHKVRQEHVLKLYDSDYTEEQAGQLVMKIPRENLGWYATIDREKDEDGDGYWELRKWWLGRYSWDSEDEPTDAFKRKLLGDRGLEGRGVATHNDVFQVWPMKTDVEYRQSTSTVG